jgi:hypothetical protein
MNAALDRVVNFVSANTKTIPYHCRDRLCRHDPDVHVSNDAIITTVTEGPTIDDEIEGVQFDCGCTSPYFITEMKS